MSCQLDVDHIMPRAWFTHWPLGNATSATTSEAEEAEQLARGGIPLSERQKMILARQASISTLGNLTLLNLSVNREAKHYAFSRKRDLLIANTSLRLNISRPRRLPLSSAPIRLHRTCAHAPPLEVGTK